MIATTTKVVRVKDLNVRFGDFLAVSRASLRINEGEFVALIGPSGCGKSTLLRAIAGTLTTTTDAKLEGHVSVLGVSPTEGRLPAGTIDMVFQEDSLLPWRTLLENVRLALEIIGGNGKGVEISPLELLDKVGLKDFAHCYPRQLSGGMKRRATVISSLITCPKLYLMDEPFANLDEFTRREMWGLIMQFKNRILSTSLLVTHMPAEAVVLADRILIMVTQPGRIVRELPVDIPWPRIDEQGVLRPECSGVINQIVKTVVEVRNERNETA